MSNENKDPVALEAVLQIRDHFEDMIIRRTINSKTPDGKPISSLRPYQVVPAYVCLRPDEFEALAQLADDDVEAANGQYLPDKKVSRRLNW